MEFPQLGQEIVETVAKLTFGSDVQIENVNSEEYSSNKVGFLGEYRSLKITARSKKTNGKTKVQEYFVKFNDNCVIRKTKYYEKEIHFYSVLLPKLQTWKKCPKFAPEFYYGNSSIIILEDLRNNGFEMKRTKFLDVRELNSCAIAIARLHASSILTRKQLGKPLNVLYPISLQERVFAVSKKEGWNPMIVDLLNYLAPKSIVTNKRLENGLKLAEAFMDDEKTSNNHVISHGDSWFNNFMFDKQDPPNCLLIDFQIPIWADQVVNLLQLLYLNTDRKTRQQSEKLVLESYQKEFSRIIAANDQNLEFRNFDQLIEAYENNRLVGLMYAIIYYPVILLEQKIIDTFDNGLIALNNIFHRSSNDIVINYIQKDSYLEKRFIEIAEEFIDFCDEKNIPEF